MEEKYHKLVEDSEIHFNMILGFARGMQLSKSLFLFFTCSIKYWDGEEESIQLVVVAPTTYPLSLEGEGITHDDMSMQEGQSG